MINSGFLLFYSFCRYLAQVCYCRRRRLSYDARGFGKYRATVRSLHCKRLFMRAFAIASVINILETICVTLAVLSVNAAVFLRQTRFCRVSVSLFLLVSICWLFSGSMASAQSSGNHAPTKVAVAEVTTETIADFAELQGRLVAGATESVTAVTSAEIEILDLQLGDVVAKGQDIAQQDPSKTGFEPRYASGPACRNKSKTRGYHCRDRE